MPFLLERRKIHIVEQFAANLHDKKEYVILVRNLKQAFNHGLVLEKVYRVITFNQKAWLKPYIDINTKISKTEIKAKNCFEKKKKLIFMNISDFGKTMENVRKYRDIKLVATETRKNYLASKPSYRTTNFFSETLLAIEVKRL